MILDIKNYDTHAYVENSGAFPQLLVEDLL